jgi:MFS family permease
MQIPAGYLLDRFNARYVVSAGVLLLAAGTYLASISNSIVMFGISNLIQGMGGSFAFIAAAVLISQWFSNKNFPIMFGLTQTLSCICAGVIHSVMANQLLVTTWNTLYQFLSICGLLLFIISIIVIKSPKDRVLIQQNSLGSSLMTVFKNKQIMLCAIAAATSFGILLAYASFWYMSVEKFYAVKVSNAYFISALIFAGIGIGTPVLGFVSNWLQTRIVVIHVTLVLGTMCLLAGIYLPHFDTQSLLLIKIISFLIGFLLSGSMLFYTMVSELSSDSTRGVALSVTNTGAFMLNALMMFIPYLFITSSSTQFFSYLWILPCFILIAILLVYFIKDTFPTTSS